jgi:hypothetical protein
MPPPQGFFTLWKNPNGLTYYYDRPTYLKTIRAKVVMLGIKLKLMKCTFELTHFYDPLTYLMTVRGTPTSRKEDRPTWQNNTRVFELTYFSRSQRSKFICVRLPIIPRLQIKLCQLSVRPLGLLFNFPDIFFGEIPIPIQISNVWWTDWTRPKNLFQGWRPLKFI